MHVQCPIPFRKEREDPGPTHQSPKSRSPRWRPSAKQGQAEGAAGSLRVRGMEPTPREEQTTHHIQSRSKSWCLSVQNPPRVELLSPALLPPIWSELPHLFPDCCIRPFSGPISCLDRCSGLLPGLPASILAHPAPSTCTQSSPHSS